MYLIRLDDASEYMHITRWNEIEQIMDNYNIKPIVGVIPNNQDNSLVSKYKKKIEFWDKAKSWQLKDWSIALHGYNHVCSTSSGGINPVNFRSEFANVSLEEQKIKITKGIKIFKQHGINTKIFFAPSHTFDMNTLEALRTQSNIRIISDTIANDVYKMSGFYFIPQQSGHVQRFPFKVTTFCYHPNNMNECDFKKLEDFINNNRNKFGKVNDLLLKERKRSIYDNCLRTIYFASRNLKKL